MPSNHITPVDDAHFDELVLQSKEPVLIKFSSRYCPPCRALAPVVERIAAEAKDRCRVFSVDVDDAPRTATKLGIRAVPTLLAFRDGAPRGQLVGVASREAILRLIG
jgi:thioredoxin 1